MDINIFDELLCRAKNHGSTKTTQFLIQSFFSMSRPGCVAVDISNYGSLDQKGRIQFEKILNCKNNWDWDDNFLYQIEQKLSALGYPLCNYDESDE